MMVQMITTDTVLHSSDTITCIRLTKLFNMFKLLIYFHTVSTEYVTEHFTCFSFHMITDDIVTIKST